MAAAKIQLVAPELEYDKVWVSNSERPASVEHTTADYLGEFTSRQSTLCILDNALGYSRWADAEQMVGLYVICRFVL